MTIQAATKQLWRTVQALRDDFLVLRLQAVEDRPRDEPNKLVDDVGGSVEALAGWAEELLDGTARAVAADDLPTLRVALDACTAAVERVGAQLHEELASTRRIDDLTRLGREGGAEQMAWVGAIKHALDRAHQSLCAAQADLITCWRELADRAVPGPAPESAKIARRT